ncbi:mechanosensitive ion channel family protein [Psychromarinibacter sp. C21-152]|uniref:Small-conductance mechanosensitive channel n=1 Tax=Psychromarinibacter sediminicola TaxID=3033385 RepID=A0AAE3NWM7_9RHOB|nr:mechanosensitive ion channel family protein [Psychromarinibacter sediminicola]MDF0603477.1 mechanosensitive ion channel family protein [Psychromarinibacter sediminicola]
MTLDQLMAMQIAEGVSVGDILTIDFIASVLGNVLAAILILIAGFVIGGWVSRRLRKMSQRHARFDETLFNFLGNIARYAILAVTIIFVLNRFGLETTSLVAALGAAGLAIGLALQGTLSNVAAGIMIILFRPIKVGDFVEVAGRMGTVKDITLNYTELASLGNVQIIIPNSEVWGNTIENYSIYPTRRAEWTFGVSYGSDLQKAQGIILDTIMADPRSQSEPEPFIQVNNLGDSSVDFLVRVWVDAGDYFAYQADMKRKVKEALDAGGVEIPFPYRTVVMGGGEAPKGMGQGEA